MTSEKLDNGNIDGKSLLVEGTAYIDYNPIMKMDWKVMGLLSGRKMGKTTGLHRYIAQQAFPDYETLLNKGSQYIYGSVVGKMNEVTTTDNIAPWGWWLRQIIPDDLDFEFRVHKNIAYLDLFYFNDNNRKEVVASQKVGVYGALSQINTMRRLGDQGIKILIFEECNPEKEDHPFVGTDTKEISSIVTSMIRVPDGVRIVAIGNQQIFPSRVLKFIGFDEDNLGLHDGKLFLMLDRPKLDNSNDFTSLVNTTDEYDSLSRRVIHDVSTLKNKAEFYVENFNRPADLFITNVKGVSILGWYTMYKDERAMFVTSVVGERYLAMSKPIQAYQGSPYPDEREQYNAQVDYLQKSYYRGKLLLGKGDRATYYGLAQLGCISAAKVKEITEVM